MTLAQLQTLQVKLTYVGPQDANLPSLGFTSSSHTFNLGSFAPFLRPGFNYSNDSSIKTFTTSTQTLKEVIENVGTIPDVRAGGVAEGGFLSFSLFNSQPTSKGFEAIVGEGAAGDLFTQLRLSLSDDKAGLRMLFDMACALDLLEPGRPTDVTATVEVKITGLRPDRHTGRFVGSISVKNNSGSTLPAPLSLVLDLPGTVRLAQDDGTTCGISPVGRQFVHLPVPPAGLAAGETVTMTLQLENPDKEAISSTGFKILAGPGAR